MTDPIAPFPPAPSQPERSAAPRAGQPTAPKAIAASGRVISGSGPQNESVTLSAAAQATTQLLNAARAASGVNPAAVAQLRAAVASGTYNVPPAALAQAIATGLKESQG
jgi:flagellar biosynthesis anti-sigma factor FlgM